MAKKAASKKPTKKTPSVKKAAVKKTKPGKKLVPVKKSIIEVVPELTERPSVELNDGRMNFSDVDHVFSALISAFHPEGLEEEDTDDRFIALWTLFLNCGGWTEEEFWAEFHHREEEGICRECGEPVDENGEHLEEGEDEVDASIKKTDLKIVN